MRILSRFSVKEALQYAFGVYSKNWIFFLKLFIVSTIISFAYYLGYPYLPPVITTNIGILHFVIGLLWQVSLANLFLKNYYHSDELRFSDIFKYEYPLARGLLYFVFIKFISHIPELFMTLPQLYGFAGWLAFLTIFIVSAYLGIEYCLGQYLILDREVTFGQTIRAMPYLVYGEKKNLVWAYIEMSMLLLLISLPFILIALYGHLYYLKSVPVQIWKEPFKIAFHDPLLTLFSISLYKQLITESSEDFKNELLELERENKEVDDEMDER